MRFKMRFEGEESPERRFSGTIIGVGETVSSHWTDSEWRSLKVQWDESLSIPCPERVSPWELEPLTVTNPTISQTPLRNKRPHPPVLHPPISKLPTGFGLTNSSSDTTQNCAHSGVHRVRSQYLSPIFSPLFSPKSKGISTGLTEDSSQTLFSINKMYCPMQTEPQSNKINNTIKVSCERRQEMGNGCRLFGIQLVESAVVEENSPSANARIEDQRGNEFDATSDWRSQPSQVHCLGIPALSSEPEKSCMRSSLEASNRQTRSCTKVHMTGTAVGRAIDLTRLKGYNDLLEKLEEMFSIEHELTGPVKKWQVVYTDDEDDTMLVGDDPWHEFCSMVRKIHIYTQEEARKLSPKTKLSDILELKKLKKSTFNDNESSQDAEGRES